MTNHRPTRGAVAVILPGMKLAACLHQRAHLANPGVVKRLCRSQPGATLMVNFCSLGRTLSNEDASHSDERGKRTQSAAAKTRS